METVTTSQYDAIGTTFHAVPGLSVPVEAGHTYRFEANLHLSSDPNGGANMVVYGSCLAAQFIAQYQMFSDDDNHSIDDQRRRLTFSSHNGDSWQGVDAPTSQFAKIVGSIQVSQAGTLEVHFAQSVPGDTIASSVLVGSTFTVVEIS